MRAIRFGRTGTPDVLRLEEVDEPKPSAGDVLVATRAIGVNFADVHFRRGEYFDKPVFPETPGLESAGEIVALGEGVTSLHNGQRVLAFSTRGAYAERVVVPASLVFAIPDRLAFEDAAAVGVQGLTVAHLLGPVGRLRRGQSVLVHSAAGGVGSLAVQLAKRRGAARVLGTASSEEKRVAARAIGADVVLDASASFAHEVRRVVPSGVDLALEMVGGTARYDETLACLAPFGTLVVYGAADGDIRGVVAPARLMPGNLTVCGFNLRGALTRRAACEEALAELFELVASGDLRVHRREVLPLARAADAHRALEERRSIGKFVLVP